MNDVKHHAEHTTDEPASVGAEIEHTILNSSQSHPISVKLEKKSGEFHHFIVFETGSNFFFLSETRQDNNNNKFRATLQNDLMKPE